MVEVTERIEKDTEKRWTMPAILLRVEGVVLFGAATAIYFNQGYTWWVFLLLLLVPDLAALGYLFGPRAGSVSYNVVHTITLPLLLLIAGWWFGWTIAVPLALIWLAHIGMDRAVGYGLKYPDSFKHNHLDEV